MSEVKGSSVSKSIRTETTKEADGKIIKKTITTETITDPDGNVTTNTKEEVQELDDPGSEEVENGEGEGATEDGAEGRKKSSKFNCFKICGRRNHNNEVESEQNTDTEVENGQVKSTSSDSDKSSGWRPGKFLLGKGKGDKDKKKTQSTKDFLDDVVKQHNKHRKLHGKVGDLKPSKELDVIAQGWADHLASVGSLSHSTNTYEGDRLGENVASRWGSNGADYQGYEVVDQWYSEVENYDYSTDHQSNCGHFTQVVWKESKLVGTGKAFAKDGRVFVVCNYHPAGNLIGTFKDNVFAPKK